MALGFAEAFIRVITSIFVASNYSHPTLWTNLVRVNHFAYKTLEYISLTPYVSTLFTLSYSQLHEILREALLSCNIHPDEIRNMGVRDENYWHHGTHDVVTMIREFDVTLANSHAILINNHNHFVRFSFYEPLRIISLAFQGSGHEELMIIFGLHYLRYLEIPTGVPTVNDFISFPYDLLQLLQGSLEQTIEELNTYVMTEDDSRECAICLSAFKIDELVCELPCEHLFHRNCITRWLRTHPTCPLDRTRI